MTWGTQQN